jgi:PST family polysaccharide transporter
VPSSPDPANRPPDEADALQGKGRAVLGGVAVSLGAHVLTRTVNLVVTILLARTIAPEGMGVVAAALLAVEVVDTVRDLGLREAVVYQPGRDERLFATALAMVIGVAVLQALLLLAAAPAATHLVDDPQIVPVLTWLALMFPLTAAGALPEAMLQRSLRFVRRTLGEVVGIGVKATVAITLIVQGHGIWGLVFGMLAGAAAGSATLWLLAGWRPRALPAWEAAVELFRYGRHIMATSMMALLRFKADQFAIALAMGDAVLGIYFIAARIPEILIFGVNTVITKVVFPTFARIAGDLGRLRRAYLLTLKGCMALMAPVSVGLAVTAEQTVPLLFGDAWGAAVPVLALLALSGIPLTIGWSAGDYFKATGRPDLLSLLMVIEIAVTGPVVWAVAFATRDLVAVASAMLACELGAAAVRLVLMRRIADVGIGETLAAAVAPLVASAAMAAAVLAFAGWADGAGAITRLAGSVALGMAVYAGAMVLLDRRGLREAWATVRGHEAGA